MPLGVPRMNKRRYAEVVRLLKGVINNPNGKIEQRLRAADTLLSIYDRHDRTVEKRERRLLKLSPEDEAPEAVPDKPVEPSAEDAARAFLERIGARLGSSTKGGENDE